METLNIPAAQLAMPTTAVQSSLAVGMPGGQALGSDAFAALLMNLLGGGLGQSAQGLNGLFSQLPLTGEEQPGEDPQDLDAAMQMMAELMMGSAAGQQAAVWGDGSALQQVLGAGHPVQDLWNLQQPVPQTVQVQQQTQSAGDFAAVIQSVPGQADAQTMQNGTQADSRQDPFLSAVQQAKRMLQEEKVPDNAQPLDIDQLQSQVDAGRFSRTMGKTVEQAALPQPEQLVEQVRKGVFEQAFSGKQEFTVKLKPEGLGEITVKMVEKDQGITLQIIASNPQVAKMLTSELGALQNALRPYHAEVQQVVSQPQQSGESTLAGGFANQDFGGHQHQSFTGQSPQPAWEMWEPGEESIPQEDDPVLAQAGLDAYI